MRNSRLLSCSCGWAVHVATTDIPYCRLHRFAVDQGSGSCCGARNHLQTSAGVDGQRLDSPWVKGGFASPYRDPRSVSQLCCAVLSCAVQAMSRFSFALGTFFHPLPAPPFGCGVESACGAGRVSPDATFSI